MYIALLVTFSMYRRSMNMCLSQTRFNHGSTKRWKPESGNGNGITEYRIRERRFQAIDLKNIYISNDNKINKQIKKDVNE